MTQTTPEGAAPDAAAAVVCPFCASTETELLALFGQSLLASQYYCRGCKTVFEAVRWPAASPDDSTGSQAAQPPADNGR